MTRQERRQRERKLDKLGIKEQDFLNLWREEGMKLVSNTINDYSACIALVLRDKLGFGTKRIHRFLNNASEMFSYLEQNRLSIEDIKHTLKEEVKVYID